jgi:hypothetical protein
LPDEPAPKKQKTTPMKNDTKNKTGNGTKNAQSALADINSQIEALNKQRIGLAEPLKARHTELTGELLALEIEVKELDPSWRPVSLRPKVDDKIMEVITANGQPMTAEAIVEAVGTVFSPWKVKSVLKKRSTGPKAVFTLADGKYAVKAA